MIHTLIAPQPLDVAVSLLGEDGYRALEVDTPPGVRMMAGGVLEPSYWVDPVPPTYLLVEAPESVDVDGIANGINVQLYNADGSVYVRPFALGAALHS